MSYSTFLEFILFIAPLLLILIANQRSLVKKLLSSFVSKIFALFNRYVGYLSVHRVLVRSLEILHKDRVLVQNYFDYKLKKSPLSELFNKTLEERDVSKKTFLFVWLIGFQVIEVLTSSWEHYREEPSFIARFGRSDGSAGLHFSESLQQEVEVALWSPCPDIPDAEITKEWIRVIDLFFEGYEKSPLFLKKSWIWTIFKIWPKEGHFSLSYISDIYLTQDWKYGVLPIRLLPAQFFLVKELIVELSFFMVLIDRIPSGEIFWRTLSTKQGETRA